MSTLNPEALADELRTLRARVAYLEGELHETIGENADLVVRAEKAEAERDALRVDVTDLRSTCAMLRAQVDAARAWAKSAIDHHDAYGEHDDGAYALLRAMDESKP